jgi:hypothetical protein
MKHEIWIEKFATFFMNLAKFKATPVALMRFVLKYLDGITKSVIFLIS